MLLALISAKTVS